MNESKPLRSRSGRFKTVKSRRQFIRSTVLTVGAIGASLLGFLPTGAASRPRLRPPGALDEQEFLAACIKCGQCVQVCPVQAIKLAELDDRFGVGTPYIDARKQACDFSCDALACVLACPTGALSHAINYPRQARMGLARLGRPDLCLARQGRGLKGTARGPDFQGRLRYLEVNRWDPIPVRQQAYDLELCDLCVRQCPIEIQLSLCRRGEPPSRDPLQCPPKHAITLESMASTEGAEGWTPVVHEGCVGCGVCEMICPAEPAAIVVDEGKTWGQA